MTTADDRIVRSRARGEAVARAHGMEYLTRLPTAVPAARYLVHNRMKPGSHLGTHGFRAWLQTDLTDREICPCGWAPELGPHYRVALYSPGGGANT